MKLKSHFAKFLNADPERLHFAAHSHHLWPDVTFDAQQAAWNNAAKLVDGKWGHVLEHVLTDARSHVARILNLPNPESVAFAPNTHELLLRLISCLVRRPNRRVLTTTSEFHSFTRQIKRLEEEGMIQVDRIDTEPFDTFPQRFLEAASSSVHELIFVSHVFYDSGYVFEDMKALVEATRSEETYIAMDGYHGFMALPTDLSELADRIFYLAGGYKYAMAGEGACFIHLPPGYAERPISTGWFADFGDLDKQSQDDESVAFSGCGYRFHGATFDPTALYRFNAAMDLVCDSDVTVTQIHQHGRGLQSQFLTQVDALNHSDLALKNLVPGASASDRGHFLTFETPNAAGITQALASQNVVVDARGDRLRIGFGIYHDEDDVTELCNRIQACMG